MVGAREGSFGGMGGSAQRAGMPLPAALRTAGRGVIATVAALALAAAVPPITFAAFAAMGFNFVAVLLVGLLMLAPAVVTVAAALLGFQQVVERFAVRTDTEHEQAIWRIFCATAVLGYVFAVGTTQSARTALEPCLTTVSLALAGGWLVLLHVILNPEAAPLRRTAATLGDIAALSAFLHFGGALAAPGFGMYLLVSFYNGFRFGLRALWGSAMLSLAGFAATVATTAFWQQQPALTAGVVLALVVLPAYVAARIRDIGVTQRKVDEAIAAKNRFLVMLGRALRGPADAMMGMSAAAANAERDRAAASAVQLSAGALLSQIDDIVDFTEIEAGRFEPQTEAFDLHDLVNETLAGLRQQAAAKGLVLALRVDPGLPHRLRGWPEQLRRIVNTLVSHAIAASEKGKVRVGLDQLGRDERAVRLRLSIRDDAPGIGADAGEAMSDPLSADAAPAAQGRGGFGLAVVRQRVALMGGEIAVDSDPERGNLFAITLPFAIDGASAEKPLDLGRRPVLIVTDDSKFAGDLAEPLNAWQADVRWIGMSDAALDYIERFEPAEPRPIVIIDGRREVLEALTFAHRSVTSLAVRPTFVLFVAEPPWIEPLIDLADGELSGLLSWPLADHALGAALHALPLEPNAVEDLEAASAVDERPEAAAMTARTRPVGPRRPVAAAAREAENIGGARPRHTPASPTLRLPPAASWRPFRVLVADDDDAGSAWIGGLLADRGHEVYRAVDGEAALKTLEGSEFDVALMSIEMPELTGYEAARLYRMGHFEGPRLPIIALTREAGADIERLCREAGMDAVLLKPVETGELIAAVEDAVGAAHDLAGRASTVTPIAAHPRFIPENSPIVDERAVEALRSLGGGSDFFQDVIESFRLDSRQMLRRISRAAAAADTGSFRDAVLALRSCAVNVGGARLCDMLLSLREVTARELRQQGTAHVQRLTAELARLDAVLAECLEGAEERRR